MNLKDRINSEIERLKSLRDSNKEEIQSAINELDFELATKLRKKTSLIDSKVRELLGLFYELSKET